MTAPIRERMEALVHQKQREIIAGLETLEPTARFHADEWTRGEGEGGGKSCVIEDGETYEKGGVNVSVVYGTLPPRAVDRMRADHKKLVAQEDGNVPFYACGLSMVIHPSNPHAPTTHLNYRYFETWNPDGTPQTWWFGGGADLTPSYLYEADAQLFHQCHKDALNKHDTSLYPKYKKWCDEYFYIKHRQETRGIGGIFFDDLDDRDPELLLAIVESCFDAFLPSYVPVVARRKDMPFTDEEKYWQQLRRGRYVEFNLVLDRGTQFGLQTPGSRVESILMSLPATAGWKYNHKPQPGSREDQLLEVLRTPREWV